LRQRAAERSRLLFQDFLRAPFADLRLETDIDASLVAVGDLSFSRAFLRAFLANFSANSCANFPCELFLRTILRGLTRIRITTCAGWRLR